MDPNAVLITLRTYALKMQKDYYNPDSNGIDQEEALAMSESFQALDEWLSKGGFLPTSWQRYR